MNPNTSQAEIQNNIIIFHHLGTVFALKYYEDSLLSWILGVKVVNG